jgi:hypothetical protein
MSGSPWLVSAATAMAWKPGYWLAGVPMSGLESIQTIAQSFPYQPGDPDDVRFRLRRGPDYQRAPRPPGPGIAEMAAESEFTAMVPRLGCLRGVSTLTGFALAVEIGAGGAAVQ